MDGPTDNGYYNLLIQALREVTPDVRRAFDVAMHDSDHKRAVLEAECRRLRAALAAALVDEAES